MDPCARVDMVAVVPPFWCEGCAGDNWVTRFYVFVKKPEVVLPTLRSAFQRISRYPLNLDRRTSSNLAGSAMRGG